MFVCQILLHSRKTLCKHLWCHVGIVGSIEQMVGRGDGEHHADDFRTMGSGKIVIESRKILFPIYLAHHFVCLHHGSQRLHARHGQRQIDTAMRHHHLYIMIAGQHIA